MAFTPFKLDTIVLTSPTATFSRISEANIQTEIDTLSEAPAGHPAPMFAAVKTAKPKVTFKTTDLDILAANVPAWGIAPGATLYQKVSTGVAPVARAGTTNRKALLTATIMHWNNITLPARDKGTADMTICSIYNGSAEPIIWTPSVALVGTMTAGMYFGCGPVWIVDDAGSPVTTNLLNVDSITIDNEVQFRSDGDCSSIYDTYGEVSIKSLTVTIKTKLAQNVSLWPQSGTKAVNFIFFARKFKGNGSVVADATAEHIKFSTTSALVIPMNTQASEQGLYADTFKVQCNSPDGTTPPLVMTASQAIAAP